MNEQEIATRKALFYTNIAYLLADMANTAVMDADTEFKKISGGIKSDERKKFSYAKNQLRKAKEITERIAKPIYKLSEADDACSDSDYLFEALKLIIDRTSETTDSKKQMLEYITQMPSKMGIYEFVKQEIE